MPGKENLITLKIFIEEYNNENEINIEIHAITKSNDIKEISKKESIKLIIENDESFSKNNDSNKNDNSENNYNYNNNSNKINNNYELGEKSLHVYINENILSNNN